MIKNIVSVEEFRINLAELIGQVMYGKDRVMIKKYNRDAAILLSIDDYEKLLDPTKRLNSSQWAEAVKKLDDIREDMPENDPQKIKKTIKEALKQVRAENKSHNV